MNTEIKKRSITFGVAVGLLSLLCSPFVGTLAGCCPIGALINIVPVVFSALLAGELAAMFLDWSQIPHEQAMSAGVRCGALTGLIASAISATATFLIALVVGGSFWTGMSAEIGRRPDGSTDTEAMTSLVGSNIGGNLLIAVVSLFPGVIAGIIGGVIGAAFKKPSRS